MFQILEFTEARLASVTNRIEKHGDEDVPAVSLTVEITGPNTMLDSIDPSIRHALYKAVDDQEQLPGVEASTPVLRCNSFDTVALTTAHEGWTLQVDDGIDDTDPMEFGGVKVDKLRVDAKQGGSVALKVRLGTSDVDAERLGKLGMHNGQSIWLKLLKPEPKPEGATEATGAEIDGTKGHPGAAAAGQGSLLDDSAPRDDGLGTFADDMARGDAGPGEGDPDDEGDGSEGGHPDAGAAEQAELEAGMRESIAAAGVAPKGRRGRKPAAEVH